MTPSTIVAIYALVTALWLAFSDPLLSALSEDAALVATLQNYTGWFFLPVTVILLYALIHRSHAVVLGSQDALRKSEAQLQAILDHSTSIFICVKDLDGRYLLVNRLYETLFGVNCDRIIGKTDRDFLPPEAAEVFHANENQAIAANAPLKFEETVRYQDGLHTYVSVKFPLRDPDGTPYAICDIATDITERKRMEEELRESEEKLRLILHYAPVGISINDLEGRLVSVNPAFCSILGYSAEELRRMSVIDITHPDDVEKTHRRYAALSRGEIPSYELEKRYIRKDGAVIIGRVRAALVRDARDEPLLIFGEIEDVTERKRMEEELLRLSLYLKNIIDSMPSVLVVVNPQGRVTEWNAQAAALSRMPWEEAQGRVFSEVFPLLAAQMEPMRLAVRQGQPVRTPRVIMEIGTETRYVDVMVYPLIAEEVVGAVIRLDDVTTRVRMDEMMMQTEKMLSLGGLAAGLAHEINNPLGTILQGSQNVLRRVEPELPKNREVAASLGVDLGLINRYLEQRGILGFIESIREAGERATKIIADMLAFSRRSEPQLAEVDPRGLVDTALRLAASDYDLKKKHHFERIAIERDYDPALGTVPCDRTEIEQVVLNLLKNAAQAMAANPDQRQPPRITLRTGKEPGHARIEVIDNGPGMDDETRRQIFEPFFTTKPVGAGTGLGLSVSYFIVTELHKGTLAVESAPGQGARFVIRLPLKPVLE